MLINDNQYLGVIELIKTEISKAQYSAALHVNKELTLLYYLSYRKHYQRTQKVGK